MRQTLFLSEQKEYLLSFLFVTAAFGIFEKLQSCRYNIREKQAPGKLR